MISYLVPPHVSKTVFHSLATPQKVKHPQIFKHGICCEHLREEEAVSTLGPIQYWDVHYHNSPQYWTGMWPDTSTEDVYSDTTDTVQVHVVVYWVTATASVVNNHTYRADRTSDMVMQTEYIPSLVPRTQVQHPHIQSVQDVRCLELSVGSSHGSFKSTRQVM